MTAWQNFLVNIYSPDGGSLIGQITDGLVAATGTQAQHEIGDGSFTVHANAPGADLIKRDRVAGVMVQSAITGNNFWIAQFIIEAIENTNDPSYITVRGRDITLELTWYAVTAHISREVGATATSDPNRIGPAGIDFSFNVPAEKEPPDYYNGWIIADTQPTAGIIHDYTDDVGAGLSRAILTANWTAGLPAPSASLLLWGVEKSDDALTKAMSFVVDGSWTLDTAFGQPTTQSGVYVVPADENVFQILNQIAEQTGEFWERPIPGWRQVKWLGGGDFDYAGGGLGAVELRQPLPAEMVSANTDPSVGIILPGELNIVEAGFDLVTRVLVYGAGLGDNRLSLKDLGVYTPIAGYSLFTDFDGEVWIINDAAESGGRQVAKTQAFPWIGPASDSAAAKATAADQLYNAGVTWLADKVSGRTVGRIGAICHTQILPNRRLDATYAWQGINYSGTFDVMAVEYEFDAAGGYLVQTLTLAGEPLRLREIPSSNSLSAGGGPGGRRYSNVKHFGNGGRDTEQYISHKIDEFERTLAHAHIDAWGGAGGGIPVSLDADAETVLSLTIQELGLQTQVAATAWMGPVSGIDVVPTFRALETTDFPYITPGDLSVATTNDTGPPHTHAIISSSTPGAAAFLTATDAGGYMRIFNLAAGSASANNSLFFAAGSGAWTDPADLDVNTDLAVFTRQGNHANILVQSGTNFNASLLLGDVDDRDAGAVVYNNFLNSLALKTNATDALVLNSTQSGLLGGGLQIGSTSTVPAAGQIHFDHISHALRRNSTDIQWYDGTQWVTLNDTTSYVPDTRAINTTSPLAGGGDLTADRTITLAGLTGLGTGNYIVGVNSGASAWEYKQLAEGTGITITHAAGSVTFAVDESGFTTPGTLSVSSSNAVGPPHTHAITSSSAVTTATETLLASNTAGGLRIMELGLGIDAGDHVLYASATSTKDYVARFDAGGNVTIGVINFSGTVVNDGTAYALRAVVTFSPTTAGTRLYGMNTTVRVDGGNDVDEIYSSYGRAILESGYSGQVGEVVAFYADQPSVSGGSIVTAYGLYVAAVAQATNNYAIYSNSGLVRFGDDVMTAGGLQVGDADLEPTAGQIHLDHATHALRRNSTRIQWYDGTAWRDLAYGTELHDAVTLSATADSNLLSLTGQEVGLDTQAANLIFAGPTSGGAAVPSFRALVAADVPGNDAEFVVLATTGDLANERVLTAGTGISITDNGADSTVVIDADESGFTTPGTLSVSSSNAAGPSHTHAIDSSSAVTTATETLLASNTAGGLRIMELGLGTDAGTQVLSASASSAKDYVVEFDANGNTSIGVMNFTGTITNSGTGRAFRSVVTFSPTADDTILRGANTTVRVTGARNVNDIQGLYARAFLESGYSGVVDEAISVYAERPTVQGGSINTAIGVYVAPITQATNNYAVYTAGAGLIRFGDDVMTAGGLTVGDAAIEPTAGQIHFDHATHALRRNSTDVQWWDGSQWVTLNDTTSYVPDTRAVNTTSPLAGGGDLTADRTITLAGLTGLGTGNYIVGVNSGGAGWEYKGLVEGANVTITHGAGSITIAAASSGAPTDAPYLVVSNNSTLTAERALVAGDGLTGSDGGANGSYTLNVGAGDGITVNANDVALATPGTLTVATGNAAAGSHTHAITSSSAVSTATAVLLASDSSGRLQVRGLGVNTAATADDLRVDADLTFIGAQTITNTAGHLTVAATGDVLMRPAGYDVQVYGNVFLRDAPAEGGELRVTAVELAGTYRTSSSGTSSDTLRPNGDGTNSGAQSTAGNRYSAIDDDPDSPNTSDYVYNAANGNAHCFVTLDNTQSNFASWQSLDVKFHITTANFTENRAKVYAQVFESDEATTVTEEVRMAEQDDSGLQTVALYCLPGDKSTWDGARLRIRWTYQTTGEITGTTISQNGDILGNNRANDAIFKFKGDGNTNLLVVDGGFNQIYLNASRGDCNLAGAALQAIGTNIGISNSGGDAALHLYTYGGAPAVNTFRARKARGSDTLPTATQAGDPIARFGGAGHTGTQFITVSTGYVQIHASEETAAAAYGTDIRFYTTANGTVATNEAARITDAGALMVGDTANANMTVGITINQIDNDDEALAIKSSDVDHEVTDITETDTYFRLVKHSPGLAGAALMGFSEDLVALNLIGTATNADTTETTSGSGAIILGARLKSGTGQTGFGNDDNILVVRNFANTRLIVKGNGDLLIDGTQTSYDNWDDAALCRAADLVLSPGTIIANEFDQSIRYGRKHLEQANLVSFDDNDNYFVNVLGFLGLHNGAIGQIRASLLERDRENAELHSRIAVLERQLAAMTG